MKTIKKIFTAITLCLVAVVVTGCFASGEVTKLSIDKMPTTTFDVNQEEIDELMTIVINDSEEYRIILSWSKNEGLKFSNPKFEGKITLSDFDLSKEGSFTASVKYNNSVSYFDYQVIGNKTYFAGGDGTVNNPYQITNFAQLQNIKNVNTKGKYFKLMNDIDLSETKKVGNYAYVINTTFMGILDGNNKKLYNLATKAPLASVFKAVKNAKIMNLSLYMNEIEASLTYNVYGNVEYTNVNVYGSLVGVTNNVGAFVVWSNAASIRFENCNNYVDFVTTTYHNSAFVGATNCAGNYFEFINCTNYGNMQGENQSMLVSNIYGAGAVTYFLKNVTNKGNIFTTKENTKGIAVGCCSNSADAFVAAPGSEEIKNLGTFTKISSGVFANFAEISSDNKVVLKALPTDSKVTKIKVVLTMYYMYDAAKVNGTLSQSIEKDYIMSGSSNVVTDFYAAQQVTELDENGTSWLEYVEGKGYVFNGFANDPKLFDKKYDVATPLKISLYIYEGSNLVMITEPVAISTLINK